MKPGDVLVVPGGKSGGRAAVLSIAKRRRGDVRLRAITPERRQLTLGPRDFPAPPRAVGHIDLPSPYAPNNAGFQRQVASALMAARLKGDRSDGYAGNGHRRRGERAMAAAEELAAEPVASCPDLGAHLRAADRADRFARDVERLERRIRGRTESLAR